MIRLQTVQAKDSELLWNINQKYLYEMTHFYDDPMDENGIFIMVISMSISRTRKGQHTSFITMTS